MTNAAPVARSVAVRLQMEVAGYIAGGRKVVATNREIAAEMQKTAATQKKVATEVGRGLAIGGAAVLGTLGLATKAAMDWETAWAGVTKTVNGTTGQMADLEDQLRGLATSLPATHEEIAGVAEAAGQLGIAREDVTSFTKTMIDLGVSTNLTAEDAATAIAQMANVMGTAPKDIDRLGATLVALGNDGASTERQIIEMSQRIAGAGHVVGLTEGQVLAFSNAVASMGIDVEAGGSSVSRTLTSMSKASQEGGAELEAFASTAGMTADQFATAFKEKPAEAFAAFIEGLGHVQETGGNVFAVLDKIGLSDVRVSQALLGMASSGDLLRNSLDLQGKAWQENTALVNEANKRYETAASRVQVARNQINEAAIDIGDVLLPAVADAAGAVGDLAQSFSELPGPARTAVTVTTGLAGTAALLGGGFLLAAPRIVETRKALDTLSKTAPRTTSLLTSVGKAAGYVGVALVALGAIDHIFDGVNSEFLRFAELVEAGAGSDTQGKIQALQVELERLQHIANDGIIKTDLGFTTIRWNDWTNGASAAADKADWLKDRIAELKQQQKLQTIENSNAGTSASSYADVIGGQVSPAVEDATDAIKSYSDALADTTAIDAYTAQAQLAKSFGDLSKEIKTAGKVTNDEKIALGGYAKDVKNTAAAVFEQTGSQKQANEVVREGRRHFIDLAHQAGILGEKAKTLADRLGLVPSRTDVRIVESGLDQAISKIAQLRRQAGVPISVTVNTINRLNTIPGGPRVGKGQAGGGMVVGPGGPTDDAVPIWGSNGEFMVKAAAVKRYGVKMFEDLNAERLAKGGRVGGHGASATAAAVAAATRRVSAADSVEDIDRAIRAVERLTQAYADQQAMHGMNAKERRRYHAEQTIEANKERLDARRDAAQAREEAAKDRAANKAGWEFEHLTQAEQLAALDKRIAGEKKYSDQWLSDSRQREQIAADMAKAEQDAITTRIKAAADAIVEARRMRDEFASTVSAGFTGFGALTGVQGGVVDDAKVARLTDALKQAQKFGTTDDVIKAKAALDTAAKGEALTADLIDRTQKARLLTAQEFAANMQALWDRGLTAANAADIINKGPEAGAAYAAALVAGGQAAVDAANTNQAAFAQLGTQFGGSSAGWIYQQGIDAKTQFLNGFSTNDSTMSASMQVFADGMIASLRESLEIHSPSRRAAREIGRHLPTGIKVGAMQTAGELNTYLRGMVQMPAAPRYVRGGAGSWGGAQTAANGPRFEYHLTAAPNVPSEMQLLQMTARAMALQNI